MYPMTVAEQRSAAGTAFLDRVLGGTVDQPEDPPDLRGYVELALRSGFPEPALRLSESIGGRWLESYVTQVITRDVALLGEGRDPSRLRRYVEAYAESTGGVPDDRTLYEAAGINRRTAIAYEELLSSLFLTGAVPAWTTNRLKRLAVTRKRFLVDAGLLRGILRIDVDGVMRDGDLLGRTIQTFACAQLRPEEEIARSRPRLHHLRTQGGRHEVDLIAEVGGGGIIGIEVKSSSAPGPDAARHLAWLRDELGPRFKAGVVLHTGPRTYDLEDRIAAVPIASMWTGPVGTR